MTGRPAPARCRRHPRRLRRGDEAEPGGKLERQRGAERDRLAMQQPVGKPCRRLQRMTESMPEIEQRPFAGLALVAGDDGGLHAAADGDGVLARGAAGEHLAEIGVEPVEERGIAEQAVFDDLRISGPELPRREGIEQRGVGDHEDRLVERTDEVLAAARIDGGLAAHRGIDLGEQRRRHLDIVEAAPHRGGGEAGEIADHPAAERHHEVAALDPRRDQRLADAFETGKALGALPGADDDGAGRDPRRGQRGRGRVEVERRHHIVGDDGRLGARLERGGARAQRCDEAASDHDVIGAIAERDTHQLAIDRSRVDRGRISRPQRHGHGILLSPTGLQCRACRRRRR